VPTISFLHAAVALFTQARPHLGKPQALRLPPVEDRLDDVWRGAGQRQEPSGPASAANAVNAPYSPSVARANAL
jgi:hypothetical protein